MNALNYGLCCAGMVVLSQNLLGAQGKQPERPPARGVRMPALSPDGKRLAFVYRGDVWIAPAKGGTAVPLTWHVEMDGYPVFSPDGRWVAFASKREGSWDIFVVSAEGGPARRLTFHGGADIPGNWSPDGKRLVFGARRDAPAYGLMTVGVDDSSNQLLCQDYAEISNPHWSNDGASILYSRYGFHWTRPRYHGSAAAEIWLCDTASGQARPVTTSGRQHLWPQCLPDNRHFVVVTVGEPTPSQSVLGREALPIEDNPQRTPNLWRFDFEGHGEPLTFFTGGMVANPSVARQSGDIAFEYEQDLWLLRAGKKQPTSIVLQATADDKLATRQRETLTSGANEAEPSPDGERVAFGLRGDVWSIAVSKPKGIAGRGSEFARRLTDWVGDDSDFSWSPDGRKLFFTSDRQRNARVFALDLASLEVQPLWNRTEDVTGLRLSPDGKHLGFWVSGPEGGLWLWTVETGEARRLVKVPGPHWRGVGGGSFSWSPDHRWIAYTARSESRAWNIYILPIQGGEPVNVTRLYAQHSQPTWSPDGKYLFFQSDREGEGLYVLPLTRESIRTADTDIRFVKPTNRVEVTIEFEDIPRRIRKLVSQGPDDALMVAADGTIYFLDQGDAWSASYDGKEVRRLTSGGGHSQLRLTQDGRKLFFIRQGELWHMSSDGKNPQKISFTAEWERDVREERKAAFTQFWRSYHRGFYDPQFHGRDWEAIGRRYESRLDSVETREEFATLLQRMVGELETSHAEVTPTGGGPAASVTPHVGFTFDYQYEGPGLKVAHVPPGAPGWYPETRIQEGDYILAINQEPVRANEQLYRAINHKQNREFEFLVHDKPEHQGARKVKYQVLSQNEWRDLLYENRVVRSLNEVESKSHGALGYIHISAMGANNQVQFEREIYESMAGRQGMIIDVRFNSGGNIADTLIDWLERKPHGFIRARDDKPHHSPLRAWVQPIVVLMNEHSYSNAEIFSYAMRARGLARLVGQATPGYVIWTDGLQLVDGTGARMPQSGFYRLDGTALENDGEKPDYTVPLTPEDWLSGRDPQLDKAIALLLVDAPAPNIVTQDANAKPEPASVKP